MTTFTTASGRTATLPKGLDLARVAGLDEDGRIVVDDFDARNATTEGAFMFGLTLCCNASDKGVEDGVVCRGCYGFNETGNYLFRAADGTFPGLDPIVGDEPGVTLLLSLNGNGPRLHRLSCKRAGAAHILADTARREVVESAPLATCCKPTEAHRLETLAAIGPWPRHLVADLEPCTLGEPVPAPVTIPPIGLVSEGKGELAGGDVQALPRTAKPRTRKGNRHDQRTALPPRGGKAEQQAALQVVREATGQTCTGACGQSLPLTKFPTTTAGKRGTECRTCRDTRRAAAKAS